MMIFCCLWIIQPPKPSLRLCNLQLFLFTDAPSIQHKHVTCDAPTSGLRRQPCEARPASGTYFLNAVFISLSLAESARAQGT